MRQGHSTSRLRGDWGRTALGLAAVLIVSCSALSSTPLGAPTGPPSLSPTRQPTPTARTMPEGEATEALEFPPIRVWQPCPDTPPSQLHSGEHAYVAFAPAVASNLRSDPDVEQGTVTSQIQPGERVRVVEGPVCQDGMIWWKVVNEGNAQTGWAAEGDARGYWLLPLAGRRIVTEEATPTGTTPSNVLFQDDFSDESGPWAWFSNAQVTAEYFEGGFRILFNAPRHFVPMLAPGQFEDVRVEVDAQVRSGPAASEFGLVCRRNFSGTAGYEFRINNRGEVVIYVGRGDQVDFLSRPQSTSAMREGVTNRLMADCVGEDLAFYVNGQLAASARDSTHSSGGVGFFAASPDEGGTDVWFDNFLVTEP
jgi:Bacterial SH3 domain